jgi:hypothetical protein
MLQPGTRRGRAGGMFDAEDDEDGFLDDVQDTVSAQAREVGDSLGEAVRIMQVQSWKASAEILTGLLAIAKSQAARAEKKAPKVEKIVVE